MLVLISLKWFDVVAADGSSEINCQSHRSILTSYLFMSNSSYVICNGVSRCAGVAKKHKNENPLHTYEIKPRTNEQTLIPKTKPAVPTHTKTRKVPNIHMPQWRPLAAADRYVTGKPHQTLSVSVARARDGSYRVGNRYRNGATSTGTKTAQGRTSISIGVLLGYRPASLP